MDFLQSQRLNLKRWGLLILLTLGLMGGAGTPEAIALGGPQPPLNEPAPTFTLPTNTGDGDVSLRD